jgi:phosphohistidine swiveling domain-containing protein
LRSVPIPIELDGPNYPYFERLFKAGKITLVEFLDKFQHLGSLDINQLRLGEYSIEELYTIFGQNKNYEHGDGRLRGKEHTTQNDAAILALGLEKDADFWTWCTYAGRFMRLREQAKFELLKTIYVLKRTFKELARLHRFGNLIYYLEHNEVLELTAKNREKFRLLALQRKAYFEACGQHRVKDVLFDFQSTPFEKNQFYSEQDDGKRYKFATGKSINYGQAEGLCLTAKSNEEYLKKLATYRTDNIENIIGVFKGVELSYFNLSALVGFTTENGGYLSHAAIIAREFRLPYITGIRVDQFQDGDYVILDTENEQVIYRR